MNSQDAGRSKSFVEEGNRLTHLDGWQYAIDTEKILNDSIHSLF
jgi:hypothetical protein